jgi:putative inorganic carbon (HCO3(-)) transporter
MHNPLAKYLPVSLENRHEIVAFLLLAGCVSFVMVSIAVSQILLAGAAIGSFGLLRHRKSFPFPEKKILYPLLAFIVWMLIAALASSDVLLGLTISKKFYLFLIIPMVPLIACGKQRVTWIYKAIFALAAVSATTGIIQYMANPERDLLNRISGFMSQWMTYAGLLMLALVLLVAYILSFGLRRHVWIILLIALVVLALIFNQTRNTWAGAIAGVSVLVLIRRPRAIVGFLVLILAFYFLSPVQIKQRFRSALDPEDPNTRNRIEIFHTAARLIRDNIWLGVGPKNVARAAVKYRGHNEYPDWMYQHMHNNILQITAEAGFPGFVIWLWLMIRLAWDALRVYRYANNRSHFQDEELRKEMLTASSAALGAWVALLVAGMAEYNFGDSEVLTLFLFIMSTPYAFMQLRSAEFHK